MQKSPASLYFITTSFLRLRWTAWGGYSAPPVQLWCYATALRISGRFLDTSYAAGDPGDDAAPESFPLFLIQSKARFPPAGGIGRSTQPQVRRTPALPSILMT